MCFFWLLRQCFTTCFHASLKFNALPVHLLRQVLSFGSFFRRRFRHPSWAVFVWDQKKCFLSWCQFLTSSWTSQFSVFDVNLAPCWLPTWAHVGSSWPQVGLMLAQVGLMLAQVGSNWNFVRKMIEFCSKIDDFEGKLELPKRENRFKSQWIFTIFQIASCVL